MDASYSDSEFDCCFRPAEESQNVVALRLDPRQQGFCTVSKLLLRVLFADGSKKDYTLENISTNGFVREDKIFFLKSDPQIIIRFKEKVSVKSLLVSFEVLSAINDEDLTVILPLACKREKQAKRNIFYRALRKIYRILRGR